MDTWINDDGSSRCLLPCLARHIQHLCWKSISPCVVDLACSFYRRLAATSSPNPNVCARWMCVIFSHHTRLTKLPITLFNVSFQPASSVCLLALNSATAELNFATTKMHIFRVYIRAETDLGVPVSFRKPYIKQIILCSTFKTHIVREHLSL